MEFKCAGSKDSHFVRGRTLHTIRRHTADGNQGTQQHSPGQNLEYINAQSPCLWRSPSPVRSVSLAAVAFDA